MKAILSACAALFLIAVAACGGGAVADGPVNSPAAGCNNACSEQGLTQCSGSQLETCVPDAKGCLNWSVPAICPNGGSCVASTGHCAAPTAVDACGGVPSLGVCEDATTVKVCATPTGSGAPGVLTYSCSAGENCQIQSGRAVCVLTAACHEGAQECTSATGLRTCSNGAWVTTTCSGTCDPNPLGASCTSSNAMTTFSGTLLYDALVPNAERTDWSPTPSTFYGVGFLVVSRGATTIYDSVYTSLDSTSLGTFTVKVPQNPAPDDRIFVIAAADDGVGGLALAVADPRFGVAGERTPMADAPTTPRLWSWSWQVGSLTPGQDLRIGVADGSGAARVYENLLNAYLYTYSKYGRTAAPLIAWLGYDTTWSCGKCFVPVPTTVFGFRFGSQLWLAGDSTNQPYWSDAVTSHELGHWTMASFGTSPNEGGTHVLGNPTFPGQAWSEGWATWFSSDSRQDPIYLDKQGGGMFWIDLAQRAGTTPFARPSATNADGLRQRMDENEVSAILWGISTSGPTSSDAVYAALASPSMNSNPFARGYTRHTWQIDARGQFTNIVDTGESKPFLGDMLDALACNGLAPAVIDASTEPTTHYPYNSSSPICR